MKKIFLMLGMLWLPTHVFSGELEIGGTVQTVVITEYQIETSKQALKDVAQVSYKVSTKKRDKETNYIVNSEAIRISNLLLDAGTDIKTVLQRYGKVNKFGQPFVYADVPLNNGTMAQTSHQQYTIYEDKESLISSQNVIGAIYIDKTKFLLYSSNSLKTINKQRVGKDGKKVEATEFSKDMVLTQTIKTSGPKILNMVFEEDSPDLIHVFVADIGY
jgi:hypothetical protein